MNRFLIIVSFLLLVSVIPLRANATTDPFIGIDDPVCFEVCPNPVGGPTGTAPFTFNANANGGGISFFTVGGTAPFNTVDIETLGVFSVFCYSDVFFCNTRILGGSVTDIFFQVEVPPGIPPGNEFDINLNDIVCNPFTTACDVNGPGGWGSGQAFLATPNLPKPPSHSLIPEPSTGSLLALGVLGLLAAKNKKKCGEVLRSL
jgi:hypothetical protein